MRHIASVQERIKRCNVDEVYDIDGDELGQGQTAKVFTGTHKETGKDYAIKLIDKAKTGAVMNDKEIAVMLKVDHPYCVKLFEVYETAEEVQLVLELLPGHDLFSRILDRLDAGKQVPYDEHEAKVITKRVALAVQHLHQKGIIHRDLKPENILMPSEDDDLLVKVGDFGLAKLFPHEGLAQATSTYVGTPGYAPPEILNHDMYSFNVDVWTLGVCTYIILCGCPPFPQDMRSSTVDKIRRADVELHFPATHFSKVSDEAKAFMRLCMDPNPTRRPNMDHVLQHPWLASCAEC
jgi:calcium/calmodulin-dependent protein kinase I